MKLLVISILALFLSTGYASAQKQKAGKKQQTETTPPADPMNQDAFLFATGLCDCMEGILKQLHPVLQSMLEDIVDIGPEEAQSRLEKKMMEASPEDQLKIMEDAERMATIDQQLQDNCSHLDSIGNKYDANEEFLPLILDLMKDAKDCTLTYKMMKLGLAGQK